MKSTVAAFCLTAASVSAFAPALSSSSTKSALSASSLDNVFGVSIETGYKCPPMGAQLLEDVSPDGVIWFQNAEIKHGRIAMMATIGYMVQKFGVHFPVYLGPSGSNVFHPESSEAWLLSSSTGVTFSDIAKAAPLDAIGMVPMAGWVQIFFAVGTAEIASYYKFYSEGRTVPGDFGYDPLGFTKREGGLESDEMKSLRMKEIKNGRVAMMTMAGWVANEAIPGALPVWHP